MKPPHPVIASTTSRVEGWRVTAHLDVVTAHVVAGANILRDLASAFTDVLGGRSHSYQDTLVQIDREVVDLLRRRAAELGADAVVGLRLDHDSVSGGGKSMFMVTASGTAVRAEPETDESVEVQQEMGVMPIVPKRAESEWTCRCSSTNSAEDDLCPKCGRAPNAIV